MDEAVWSAVQQEKQQVDNLCPCPKSVPGRPNLSHPGAPLYAAVNPSRPLLHPGRPKYSTAWPAAQLLARELAQKSSTTLLGMACRQDVMVQMKPHSQTHAVSAKDLKTFALSQALLDVPCQNWQPRPGTRPSVAFYTSARRDPS